MAKRGQQSSDKEMPWTLTFSRIHSTIRAANKHQLKSDFSEMLEIGASDKCMNQADSVSECWLEELERAKRDKAAYEMELKASSNGQVSASDKPAKKPPKEASVFQAIWPGHRKAWLLAVLLRFMETGLVFTSPIILQEVIGIIIRTQRCAADQGQVLSSSRPLLHRTLPSYPACFPSLHSNSLLPSPCRQSRCLGSTRPSSVRMARFPTNASTCCGRGTLWRRPSSSPSCWSLSSRRNSKCS